MPLVRKVALCFMEKKRHTPRCELRLEYGVRAFLFHLWMLGTCFMRERGGLDSAKGSFLSDKDTYTKMSRKLSTMVMAKWFAEETERSFPYDCQEEKARLMGRVSKCVCLVFVEERLACGQHRQVLPPSSA